MSSDCPFFDVLHADTRYEVTRHLNETACILLARTCKKMRKEVCGRRQASASKQRVPLWSIFLTDAPYPELWHIIRDRRELHELPDENKLPLSERQFRFDARMRAIQRVVPMLSSAAQLHLERDKTMDSILWLCFLERLGHLFEVTYETFTRVFTSRRTWRSTLLAREPWTWFLSQALLHHTSFAPKETNWWLFDQCWAIKKLPASTKIEALLRRAVPFLTRHAYVWLGSTMEFERDRPARAILDAQLHHLSAQAWSQCDESLLELAWERAIVNEDTLLNVIRRALRDENVQWAQRSMEVVFCNQHLAKGMIVSRVVYYALRTKRAVQWLRMMLPYIARKTYPVHAQRVHYYQFTDEERREWHTMLQQLGWECLGQYPTCEAEVESNLYAPAPAGTGLVIPSTQ